MADIKVYGYLVFMINVYVPVVFVLYLFSVAVT